MEGCFTFQWGVCFSDWGASFLSGVCAHGVIGFDAGGGGVEKNDRMGGALEMFVRNVKKQIQTSR